MHFFGRLQRVSRWQCGGAGRVRSGQMLFIPGWTRRPILSWIVKHLRRESAFLYMPIEYYTKLHILAREEGGGRVRLFSISLIGEADIGARAQLDMYIVKHVIIIYIVSLYIARLPIPVGMRGVFTCSNYFYLPSRRLEWGGGSSTLWERKEAGRQACFPVRIFKAGCCVAKWLVR
jgi:hypothetical protein